MDPVYIPSRGRYRTISTHKHFDRVGMTNWYYIVEPFEQIKYIKALQAEGKELIAKGKLTQGERLADEAAFHVVPFDPDIFKEAYDEVENPKGFQYLDDMGWKPGLTTGPGPARNAINDYARELGLSHYYMMDDDILGFSVDSFYFQKGLYVKGSKNKREHQRLNPVKCFELFERLLDKFENVGHAEFEKAGMAMNHRQNKHFSLNSKTYSCIRIRTDLNVPWRSRWNDDVEFSLQAERKGYVNVSSKVISYATPDSQQQAGGMTESFAQVGTKDKVAYLVKAYPDVAQLTLHYGRIHHIVSYARFQQPLILKPGATMDDLVYELTTLDLPEED